MRLIMWQEERGNCYFRYQTEDRLTAAKMKRRNKFKLVGFGFNCPIWIYQATFSRPDIARNALKALTGGKICFDKNEDIYWAEIKESKEGKRAA